MKSCYLKPGVSIIECTVYCVLLTMLTFYTFNWINTTHSFIKKQSNKETIAMNIESALDFLIKELRSAPSVKSLWKKVEPRELIWHQNDKDVGWTVEKELLIRSEGLFDSSSKQWHKRTKNIVCSGIKKFEAQLTFFKKFESEWINAFHVELNSNKIEVALRNGVVS